MFRQQLHPKIFAYCFSRTSNFLTTSLRKSSKRFATHAVKLLKHFFSSIPASPVRTDPKSESATRNVVEIIMTLSVCHLLRRNCLINLSKKYLFVSTAHTRILIWDNFLRTAKPVRKMKRKSSSNSVLKKAETSPVSFKRSKTGGSKSTPHPINTLSTGRLVPYHHDRTLRPFCCVEQR